MPKWMEHEAFNPDKDLILHVGYLYRSTPTPFTLPQELPQFLVIGYLGMADTYGAHIYMCVDQDGKRFLLTSKNLKELVEPVPDTET